MKKVMVIGLGPDYNYPEKFDKWSVENTRYASNHGASLISRTLLKMFDADFIDDFSRVEEYKKQYELCILAFATHITDWRDVSMYTDFVEKLDIPVAAFSLGIQDYTINAGNVGPLHPSLTRLLKRVSSTTRYIGVRGFHTASLLYKEGFSNVIPIGCPTLFNNLDPNLKITKKEPPTRPLNVFHSSFSDVSKSLISNISLLGQDFLDEAVFTDNLKEDIAFVRSQIRKFNKCKYGDVALESIQKSGEFVYSFDEWFHRIGKADFVFGPRLHGCIAALIQGIPAVMIARDTRVKEIADFFKIPMLTYEQARDKTLEDLWAFADFSDFNGLYARRYHNFITLLKENNILKYLVKAEQGNGFEFTFDDLQEHRVCLYQKIDNINLRLATLEHNYGVKAVSTTHYLFKKLARIKRKITGR